jgi:hypothetical protein
MSAPVAAFISEISTMRAQKKAPLLAGLSLVCDADHQSQWPKNSHSRMITGIGTPNSQSKIPLPMISLLASSFESQREGGRVVPARNRFAKRLFRDHFGISDSESPIRKSE